MKYKEEHEKKFPSKGEALKKRWNEYQTKQKEAREAKANATKSAAESGEQTKGGDAPEPKTEEIKDAA